MKYSSVLLASTPLVAAYPGVMQASSMIKRQAPTFESGRTNTGVVPSTTFDAEDQFVDVSPGSANEFVAPTETDLRGECPGLNAAANHGFLPHNGIPSVTQTITGLGDAYNMSPDLAGFLAVVAVALDGDYITQTWSIGGAYGSSLPGLGQPRGILGAHNKYEGDASVARGDAYLNDGNQVLNMDSFMQMYNLAENYTLDILAAHNDYVGKYSEANNPYYFSAPFAGLVTPAAHEFVINFMSNHSEEIPSGWLDRSMLKTFFAMTGPDDDLTYNIGMEQIPQNWYRRPTSNQYDIPKNLADTGIAGLMYPGVVRFGGNTGKVNTFTGVDIGDLTGGVFNGDTLLQGNNLGCFAFQALQAGLPDQLSGADSNALDAIMNMVDAQLSPVLSSLQCPEMKTYNSGLFNQYPGYNYNPQNVQNS